MKMGAYDYLVKPLDRTKLLTTVKNAIEQYRLSMRLTQLEREVIGRGYDGILGQSEPMKAVFRNMDRVAASDVTELELRNSQLHDTLTKLELSREQIRRHNDQLRDLATRDPLTGCLNRRAFFEEAEKEIRAAEIKGDVISYIIFDIDHFKSINDNHGHAVGDEVLKAVGGFVETKFSGAGLVCKTEHQ